MTPIKDFRFHEKGANTLSGIKHTHDTSYEILQVLDGTGTIMINDKLYPISKNAVFLIGKLDVHSAAPDTILYTRNIINLSSDYMEQILAFMHQDPSLLTRKTRSVSKDQPLFPGCIITNDHYASLIDLEFETINDLDTCDDLYQLKLLSHITALFLYLLDGKNTQAPLLNNSISEAVRYIDTHLSDKISVDDIAKHVHLSKYYFCHLFKQHTHMSPVTYITERRLSTAKKLMLYSDLTLSEIAIYSGFHSFSNFSNVFKKSEGICPRDFLKKR